ncbi:MAG: sulfite exporter TauE/SafE family protein [Nostocaceae cyanobacterium]|nr:sulfite exporter TauE/SafE family protein [Nostocaceae cyanobacterium]
MTWLVEKPALAHPGHGGVSLQTLAEQSLTPTLTLTGLGIAFLFGAGHALTPGHGKTMVAAYLVGSRGTAQHAVLLGFVTTLTHTFAVYTLGLLALFASQYVLPEQLYPLLSLLSGMTVCGVGVWLLEERLGKLSNDHKLHSHHHDHIEAHHHHIPKESVTLQSLIALGVAGGIVPCPSALVLLLSAIALHREGYGILLLSAFSFGLASVLVAIGLAFVYARRWSDRLPFAGLLLPYLSVGSAIVIILTGTLLAAYAVS